VHTMIEICGGKAPFPREIGSVVLGEHLCECHEGKLAAAGKVLLGDDFLPAIRVFASLRHRGAIFGFPGHGNVLHAIFTPFRDPSFSHLKRPTERERERETPPYFRQQPERERERKRSIHVRHWRSQMRRIAGRCRC